MSFMVPQHNDVNRSEVLNDFNLLNNFEYRLIAIIAYACMSPNCSDLSHVGELNYS